MIIQHGSLSNSSRILKLKDCTLLYTQYHDILPSDSDLISKEDIDLFKFDQKGFEVEFGERKRQRGIKRDKRRLSGEKDR